MLAARWQWQIQENVHIFFFIKMQPALDLFYFRIYCLPAHRTGFRQRKGKTSYQNNLKLMWRITIVRILAHSKGQWIFYPDVPFIWLMLWRIFKPTLRCTKRFTERGIAWCETFIKAVSCNLYGTNLTGRGKMTSWPIVLSDVNTIYPHI